MINWIIGGAAIANAFFGHKANKEAEKLAKAQYQLQLAVFEDAKEKASD